MADTQIQCVGIIMDGNRRWAKEKNLPSLEGHKKGADVFSTVSTAWARKFDIKNLVLYAFSTENWNRTQEEVDYLMDLFRMMMRDQFEKMVKEDRVGIRFIGERERFPQDLQDSMNRLEEMKKGGNEATVYIALSYGGRAEILQAANKLITEGKKVTEEDFSRALWTYPMPDPDIIIRTGGDMRLSGFLTWQSVYSELFFTKTLWPDFTEKEFESIVEEFYTRTRRYGK